jgi:hypothetical protein
MTPFQTVYDAFLAKILDDEWSNWETADVEEDLRQVLESAIPHFRFPRVALDRTDSGFTNTLNQSEIQILASYMKIEWLNRCILTWENIKPLYEEKDFSQANLLDKFSQSLELETKRANKLQQNYYRSVEGKPFDYSIWAGDNTNG